MFTPCKVEIVGYEPELVGSKHFFNTEKFKYFYCTKDFKQGHKISFDFDLFPVTSTLNLYAYFQTYSCAKKLFFY